MIKKKKTSSNLVGKFRATEKIYKYMWCIKLMDKWNCLKTETNDKVDRLLVLVTERQSANISYIFRMRTSSIIYENHTEKREECDNRDWNSWLALDKNEEFGRDEKNIASWTGFNEAALLLNPTLVVFTVQRMWHSLSNFQWQSNRFFYLWMFF